MFTLPKKTEDFSEIRVYICSHLSESRIPIDDIITPDVLFTDIFDRYNCIYIYRRKKKYYLKVVTNYRSEETTHKFIDLDELTYGLVSLQMMRKAYRENKLHHKEAYLEYMKEVDEAYYNRAAEKWERTHI